MREHIIFFITPDSVIQLEPDSQLKNKFPVNSKLFLCWYNLNRKILPDDFIDRKALRAP